MSQAPNPTPAPTNAAPSETPSGNTSRSQAEVRAAARPMSLVDRANAIEKALIARRQAEESAPQVEDDATPREGAHSETPPPAPEEEAREDLDEVDDDATDSQDADMIERLDDLLSMLEVDGETFGSLKTTIKVDGKDVEVTLGEALKSHQFAARNTQKAQELAAQQRKLEAEATERVRELKQTLDQGKAMHHAAYAVMQEELQSPALAQLRQSDPAQYLQSVEYLQQRMGKLEQSYNNLLAYEAQQGEQLMMQRRERGLQQLQELIPDFDTEARRGKIAKVFADRGVTPAEMGSLVDPRIWHLVSEFADLQEKVAAYEAREKDAERIARKVARKEPRTAKAGGEQPTRKGISKKALAEHKARIQGAKGMRRLDASASALQDILRRR